ncbi:2,3-diaminopropionate biosynthesis protein SbnB [Streptomyces roseifaciens]
MFEFSVIGGKTARDIIGRTRRQIVTEVRETYLTHHAGESVNPNSYFLRFPDKPDSRIIALPAYLGGKTDVAGIKWISSFPGNINKSVPRASAALLLNDYETGYPFACLEASQISAARTAASAVLAAEQLTGGRTARRLTIVGAGIIARNILEFFTAQEWAVEELVIHDRLPEYSKAFAEYAGSSLGHRTTTEDDLTAALTGSDLIVFATTAGEPYVTDAATFTAGQVVLNVSLRDIGPEIILGAQNILDDIGHCMTANTSPHLAEQKYGHRDFIDGTLAEVILGEVTPDRDRPVIFSPFGLGVLDLAVGMHVYRTARESGETVDVPDFFGETRRW